MTSPADILATPMEPNSFSDEPHTLRDFLIGLAAQVWDQGEGFSGKRPFGDSGWDYCVYEALVKAGHLKGDVDDEGYVKDWDQAEGHQMVLKALEEL